MLPKADYKSCCKGTTVMWQVISHGAAGKTLTAVSKKNPQDNQIQKGGLEDIYSGETLIQKSLPRSLRQVKGKRAEMKKTARILLLACML